MQSALLDAGPVVALFDRSDRHHRRFEQLLATESSTGLRLMTTWPCLVEAAYLLDAEDRYAMLHWIELGAAQVYPFEVSDLTEMAVWMKKYTQPGRREMDFADASLYWLAFETGVTTIMTVDLADFSRYRLPDGSAFAIL